MTDSDRKYPSPESLPSYVLKASWQALSGYLGKKYRDAYYRARESLGQHKREIVVYRVEEACDSLLATREQFESALEHFKAIAQFDGGSLELRYRTLKQQFDLSQAKAQAVNERIKSIAEVSEALFREWELELDQYSNRVLRAHSRKQLRNARQHYERLMKAMYQAEAKIHPVLAAFRDQVLFLKHNLNAQAIAALRHELFEIGVDIASLIQAMEKSINEANGFVATLVEQRSLPNPYSSL